MSFKLSAYFVQELKTFISACQTHPSIMLREAFIKKRSKKLEFSNTGTKNSLVSEKTFPTFSVIGGRGRSQP